MRQQGLANRGRDTACASRQGSRPARLDARDIVFIAVAIIVMLDLSVDGGSPGGLIFLVVGHGDGRRRGLGDADQTPFFESLCDPDGRGVLDHGDCRCVAVGVCWRGGDGGSGSEGRHWHDAAWAVSGTRGNRTTRRVTRRNSRTMTKTSREGDSITRTDDTKDGRSRTDMDRVRNDVGSYGPLLPSDSRGSNGVQALSNDMSGIEVSPCSAGPGKGVLGGGAFDWASGGGVDSDGLGLVILIDGAGDDAGVSVLAVGVDLVMCRCTFGNGAGEHAGLRMGQTRWHYPFYVTRANRASELGWGAHRWSVEWRDRDWANQVGPVQWPWRWSAAARNLRTTAGRGSDSLGADADLGTDAGADANAGSAVVRA